MEASKILSVDLIDVIFDGRNKDYGAYELRKTHSSRTRIALSVTISVVALVLCLVALGNSNKKQDSNYKISSTIELTQLPEEKIPEKLPEPEKPPEPEPVETVKFTPPEIVPDDEFDEPPPMMEDMDSARIGLENIKGRPDSFIADGPKPPGDGDKKGIFTEKEDADPGPLTIVQVPAKFIGNWEKFLLKNLDGEVPVRNGAGAGRYSVVIRFVVDKEGNVTEITPLTSHGYGLEDEAVRVLKKATKWEPAIQNGYQVKAYHKQTITFEVPEE